MAFQAVPKTMGVVVRHVGKDELAGSRAQWGLYVRHDSLPTPITNAAIGALEAIVDTWIDNEYLDLLSTRWNVQDTVIKDLSVIGGISRVGVQNEDGLRAGEPNASNEAVWIKFTGEGGSLPVDGGCFWPVGVESDLDGNEWEPTFVTSCNAAFDELQSAIETTYDTPGLVLVSRSITTTSAVRNARQALRNAINATRRAEAVTNEVVAFASRPLVATQRDRRP